MVVNISSGLDFDNVVVRVLGLMTFGIQCRATVGSTSAPLCADASEFLRPSQASYPVVKDVVPVPRRS